MSDATPSPASPSPASAPPKKKKKGPSATAKLVFSLGFVAFIFGALELVARVAGIADPFAFGGSRLAYQQIYPPLLRRVKDDKGERFRARDPRLVDRAYPVASPAGVNGATRVYCFGESAVAGLGMSENAAFARALERHLRKLGGDHAQDSVANVGIVALDSRQVLKCVQDVCAHQKPDWVVLHVGNNEFLELHALKFQAAQGKTFAIGLDEFLKNHSALYLGLKNKSIAAKNANLTRDTFQTGALQLSERTLVEKKETHVDMEETGEAIAKHKENLRKACQVAKAAGAKVILMTVATNLEWEGMRDPKDGWVAEACGGPLPEGEARKAKLESALLDLTKKADDKALGALEHWNALYKRAHVKRALGDARGALADFQLANDQDPHLRRCLSVMNENVRALAKEEGVVLVDGARVLAEASKDGITGFEQLYDYVHFTPEGAERLGAALAGAIAGEDKAAALAAQVKERLELLAKRAHDALEVEEYVGWNHDRAMLSDRNLWKYEEGRRALDEKVKAGTATPEEMVWSANGYALEVGSEARARELYAKAKQAKPELAAVIDANVRWLDAR